MRPKCIIIDIDGTIFFHNGTLSGQFLNNPDVLPGTIEKFNEWDSKGYYIILLTGRKESMREITEKQLEDAKIFYDQLIMGIGGGIRVLINDRKSGQQDDTAIAVNLDRNTGISDVDV